MSLLAALAVNVVVVLGFLWFLHRDREATARVLADFSRQAHERQEQLIQRVQAPAAAVAQHHYAEDGDGPGPQAVRSDDDADEDFWGARLSKEELAELVAREQLSG